jgi:hypothetical protein
VETCAVEFNVGVVTGDRNISDTNLALMATAKLYTCLWNILDHHNTFGLLASPFKNYIVIFWLLNRKHLNSLTIISLNSNWEFSLTNLTLEFFKVIVQCPSNNFFLDFDANPLKKTVNMHSSA